MKHVKLLYCIPALYNAAGMERVLSEKANYFANLDNYEITIVTTEQNGRPIYFPLNERIRVIHLDIGFDEHFKLNLLKKYFLHKQKLKIYRKKLENLLTNIDVDICISLCGKEIEFLDKMSVKCKKVAEVHFAMNSRKHFMTTHNNGFIWKILGRIRTCQLLNSVKNLDKFVVLTKADKLEWKKKCTNVIQIPNPNPLLNINVSDLTTKHVITIGRLDAQKGYDLLIDSWAIVALKHQDWVLDIFGHGEWEGLLRSKIDNLNLSDKVILRGLTTNVVTSYLESSIYVMSSRYEGLPMVLIEAASCGLPLVSFDCECGPREIITDGVDGFLVEPNSIEKLADKICVLIENENIRIEMGKSAFEKSKQYSSNKIMPQWVNLFEELLTL